MEWIWLSTAASRPFEITPDRREWLLCRTTVNELYRTEISYIYQRKNYGKA